MEQKPCLLAIKKRYVQLTAAEKAVADYILQESENVITMPVAELAGKAGVAKSAVIRCCKSLGFEGYAELKISLAMDLSKKFLLEDGPCLMIERCSGQNMTALNIPMNSDVFFTGISPILQHFLPFFKNISSSSRLRDISAKSIFTVPKLSLCIISSLS